MPFFTTRSEGLFEFVEGCGLVGCEVEDDGSEGRVDDAEVFQDAILGFGLGHGPEVATGAERVKCRILCAVL